MDKMLPSSSLGLGYRISLRRPRLRQKLFPFPQFISKDSLSEMTQFNSPGETVYGVFVVIYRMAETLWKMQMLNLTSSKSDLGSLASALRAFSLDDGNVLRVGLT